jgi:DNA-directed RNA polymerase specialized sigma24 family protein
MRSVESIVREMPDRMRRCYTLTHVYRMSHAAIAEKLHIPLDDVERDLVDGTKRVAKELEL